MCSVRRKSQWRRRTLVVLYFFPLYKKRPNLSIRCQSNKEISPLTAIFLRWINYLSIYPFGIFNCLFLVVNLHWQASKRIREGGKKRGGLGREGKGLLQKRTPFYFVPFCGLWRRQNLPYWRSCNQKLVDAHEVTSNHDVMAGSGRNMLVMIHWQKLQKMLRQLSKDFMFTLELEPKLYGII